MENKELNLQNPLDCLEVIQRVTSTMSGAPVRDVRVMDQALHTLYAHLTKEEPCEQPQS